MREQLIQFVTILFAGTENCEDTKAEVLLKALSQYDELIAQGETPEDAYRKAIMEIGDVREILGKKQASALPMVPEQKKHSPKAEKSELAKSISGFVFAVGLAFYLMISFLTMAWHITWVIFPIVGAINALILVLLPGEITPEKRNTRLRKGLDGLLGAIGLAVYFLVSFATGAWYITWIIFLIIGAVRGLLRAIWDLKEAVNNEA